MSSRRNRGGGGGHGDGGEERWLLPYADMITLLLGLFIVLFAMSTIDAKQFDNVKRSLSQTFNGAILEEPGDVLPGSNGVLDPTNPSMANTDSALSIDDATRASNEQFNQQAQRLEQVAKQLNLGNDVKVTRNEIGIEVRLAGDALFEPGSWDLKPSVVDQLTKLERELQRFNHPIRIDGHTDGVPYEGQWGNWGLSGNRAQAVAALFRELGYPADRMIAVAHGDTEPLVKPSSKTAPTPKNRRIEITILEPGADDPLPNLTDKELALASKSPSKAAPPPEQQIDDALEAEFDTALVDQLAETSKASH